MATVDLHADAGSDNAPPLVSVIVAAFNAAAHIEETCRSALGQTHARLELIVVDDGSTDETAAIVSRLAAADGRVRLIRQQNQGVAAARNAAIAAAQGEFLSTLDADDLWDARKLARQVARMRERGPGTGMVYCWWASIDEQGAVLDISPRWDVEGEVMRQLLEVNFTGNSSVPLFRREVVEALGGYDTSMHARGHQGCEDWDLAIRVSERYEVAVVPHVLVGYRRRRDGMSASCETMWQSQLQVTSALAARHPDVSAQTLRRSRGQFALYLAGVSFWAGDYVAACRWALRTQSITLLFGVVPHVGRLLASRLAHRLRGGVGPPLSGPTFADDAMPEPLIPYGRIYAQYWEAMSGNAALAALGRFLSSKATQSGGVMAAVALGMTLHWANDGLWFQGDAPRHAATGLFFRDLLTEAPTRPVEYALSYFARYPVIQPGASPPLFHLLEGATFGMAGESAYVAKALVWAFATLAGVYSMLWGRRFIARWAGWAGTLVLLFPGFVKYANAVMLIIPATALGLASLYHWQRWLEGDGSRHRWLFLGFAVSTAATHAPSAVLLLVAVTWALISARRARVWWLWLPAAVVLAAGLVTAGAMPGQMARQAPSAARLFSAAPWAFYVQQLPSILGVAWPVFGAAGLGVALLRTVTRRQGVRLFTAAVAIMAGLASLPATDGRYMLMLGPLCVLAACLGVAAAGDAAGRWRHAVLAGALSSMLVLATLGAVETPVPRVSGIDDVARYLAAHAPAETVLYSGIYDGVFSFYVRVGDPAFERRVVRSNNLLYRYQQGPDFRWTETPFVQSTADVVTLIRARSGCTWVAAEALSDGQLAASERLLRQALDGPEFEHVASFPVVAGVVTHIDLYRVRGTVEPVRAVDLTFPSFSARVFRGVIPVERRP